MTTDCHQHGFPLLKAKLGLLSIGVCALQLFALPLNAMAVCGENDEQQSPEQSGQASEQLQTAEQLQTTEQLRREARVLHTTIHSVLRVVHDRYYREDEGLLIPAHVMKETFQDIEKAEGIQLRWLAVEGQPMNTDHVARDDFEKSAVSALKSGRPAYEHVSETVFRRAAPITLSNHCLKCHMPDRKSTDDRVAGLVITIPVTRRGE